MTARFDASQVDTWRKQGVVILPEFFTRDEVAPVAADFEQVFAGRVATDQPLDKKGEDGIGRFHSTQFSNFENIPFDCSPALNLVAVHPALVAMAKAALGTDHVHLYQAQAWAKFTGESDFDQPFHCDFNNHTLTVPAEDETRNSITFLIYFSDVTEAHGPVHYVTRTDSLTIENAHFSRQTDNADLQAALGRFERSGAAPAGSVFAYGIDVFHRGTNLTAPGGHRYAVTSCFKRAGNESINYMAWPWHHMKPWHHIFNHATPEQLACFGVPLPGDPFWTNDTIARAQVRYPDWDMQAYRGAC